MSVSVSKFKKYQEIFKLQFEKCFLQKIETIQSVAIGTDKPTITYERTESVIKVFVESLLGNAAAGIPFIGPFASDTIKTLPTKCHEYFKSQSIIRSEEQKNNKLAEIGVGVIKNVIEEVGHEITRIFEYQIAALQTPSDCEKLAKYAVEKMFLTAANLTESNKTVGFNRDGLLKALLKEEKVHLIDRLIYKVTKENIVKAVLSDDSSSSPVEWKINDVFTKVGLRKETANGKYEFKMSSSRKPICGYRNQVFEWNEKTKSFDNSMYDTKYTDEVEDTKLNKIFTSYATYQRLVQQSDINAYFERFPLDSRANNTTDMNFISFYKEFHNISGEISPVFRNVKIDPQLNLTSINFSGVDMTRIILKNKIAISCKFIESRMISAEFHNVNFENSWFKTADLRWSLFNGVNLRGDTLLVQASLSYSVLSIDTDLTDNSSFNGADINKAIILTNKIESLTLKRLLALEEKDAKLDVILLEYKLSLRKKSIEIQELKIQMMTGGISMLSFFNVRDATDDFTGRSKPIQRIHEYFFKNTSNYVVQVVAGGGGLGKTQMVLEYVSQFKREYGTRSNERVFWLSSETSETINAGIKEFAVKLNIIIEKRSDKAILKDVHMALEVDLQRTLLIFDNVDELENIKAYLPKSTTNHHVILTTRKTDKAYWPSTYNVEILTPFDVEESVEYIQDQLKTADMNDMKSLSSLFGHMPLSLSQAVAYIKDNGLNIPEYTRYYTKSQTIGSNYENVYSTVTISFESFKGTYDQAIEIMNICSYLNADAIPIILFQSLFSSEDQLLKILLLLQENKLISLRSTDGGSSNERVIYIHRLVQEVVRNKAKENNIEIVIYVTATSLISKQMPDYKSANSDFKTILGKADSLLMHILSLISYYASLLQVIGSAANSSKKFVSLRDEWYDSVACLYIFCAEYYITLFKHDEAIHILEKCSVLFESYNYSELLRANYMQHIGYLYSINDEHDKALHIFDELLQIYEIKFGHNSSDVAETINNTAIAYCGKGEYDNALTLYKEALQIRENIYGRNHCDVAESLNNIASVYVHKREYDNALEMYKESLQILNSIYGHNHPTVANSLNNIAGVYGNKGDYDQALEVYKESLPVYENIYGHNHPKVAHSLYNIAAISDLKGEYDKALEMYKESLQINERIYCRNHHNVAMSLNAIANVYSSKGEYDKALETLNESLFGRSHADVAMSLSYIAGIYKSKGEYDKALEIYKESLQIRKNVYGRNHPDVAMSLFFIAMLYSKKGEYDKALEVFSELLQIEESIYGRNHPNVATGLSNIAGIHCRNGDYHKALEMHKESLQIRESIYDHNHPDVTFSLNNIADVKRRLANSTISSAGCACVLS